jgi:tudor domain-containing protein 3
MKVRNVAAPKVNEESKFAPRMLKIQFTDGVIQYSGIEIEPLAGLSVHTKPGTKVLLKNCPIENSQGLLLLKTNQVSVLGGNVAALAEKWELSQSMLKLSKSGRIGLGGPPPWIAFGKKIEPLVTDTKSGKFKSLASKPVEKDENTEFASQRSSSIKDAIAEANRLGAKKNFGGGNKTLIDVNVQKIIDEGYSEQDATNVLRIAKNNVRNALNILKNRDLDPSQQRLQRPPKKEKGSKQRNDDDLPNAGAPTTKISLFDFLEDKLPIKESQTSGGATKKQYPNDTGNAYRNPVKRYENNYSKYPYTSGPPPPSSTNAREFENNISASFHRKTPNQSLDTANKQMGNGSKYFNSNNGDSKSYKGTNPRSGFKNESYNNRNEAGYKKPLPRNTPYPNNNAPDNRKSAEKSLQPSASNRRDERPKSTNNYRDNQATGAKFQSGSYEQKQALYENRSSDHNRGDKSSRQQPFNHYSGQNRTRREDHAEPVAATAQAPFPSNSAKKPYTGAKPSNVAAPPKQPAGSKSHPQLQQEIIGFQNSKTNEHAMNMLKTQQAMEAMTIQQKQPAPVVPAPQAQPKPSEPNWVVGEKCLAKYWEDGKVRIVGLVCASNF